ncbi:hypothetical protein H5410_032881 [Solanum commersonii]|uniref:Protein kinase domain-containing protein n=1 Tax=Solanum commersonii TaxID=4109 RepID=A0A9J5YP55_SOLCO|nr:hypothetical protein H5410_032881 [Solanum commersonii]
MAELLWKRGTTLGQGGFGVVSLASTSNALFHGVTLPSLIAVKSCNYSDSQSLKEEEEFLGMFKHSPCIIRCFGANLSFEDEVIIYNLLLEYASGGSLANRLRNCNSLPEFEVKKHTKNVLLGLSCIHTNGIIHCDIKPDNILLVGTEETAKIDDFGLSMTFEQALITGTSLWDGYEDHVLHQIAFEKPKFQNSKLSKEAKDFLKRCLVKNPSSRWTADVLLNHPFLQNSSIVVNTAKTRKKKSDSKSLLHKPIRKITFKFGNHKFVRQLPDLKEVENETCARVLGTDK